MREKYSGLTLSLSCTQALLASNSFLCDSNEAYPFAVRLTVWLTGEMFRAEPFVFFNSTLIWR